MKKIKAFVVIFMTVVLAGIYGLSPAYASSVEVHDTDASFAEEGASAYDNLKEHLGDTTDIMSQIENSTGSVENIFQGDPVKKVWIYIFYIYDAVKSIYMALIIFTTIIAAVVYFLSTKNKKRQKRAIIAWVAIFVLTTAFVYGTPYLYLKFA